MQNERPSFDESSRQQRALLRLVELTALGCIVFAVVMDSPGEVLRGIVRIPCRPTS